MSAAGDWAWLARIRRPQGRKGEVFADILTDFPEKFAERRRVWLLAEADGASGARPSHTSSSAPVACSARSGVGPSLAAQRGL